MKIERAVKKAGTGAASAVFLHGLHARVYDLLIHGKPKIIVAAKHYPSLALHHYLYILLRFKLVKIGIYSLIHKLADIDVLLAFFE